MNSENWLKAQYSVLGSVLIEPDLVPKIIHQTNKTDFYGTCQTVYSAIRDLFVSGTPVDVVSVANALGNGYNDFLCQLMDVTPTAANIDSYIRLCREQARVAHVRELAQKIVETENESEIREILAQTNALMVDRPSLRIRTMDDLLHSFFDRHSREINYLSWPIRELDDRLYVEPGDFILVGGYPSTGKSAWTLQCAWYWAKKYKVGFFSLETNPDKLFDRLASHILDGLTLDQIKRNQISDNMWEFICKRVSEITAGQMEVIPAAGYSPADIQSVTMMRGYQIIIVDYVQLIISTGWNRTEEVTNISLALHRMAQDMGVTIVALSQLKRKNDDSTPESSDLRESGQLEQDADVIMMLKLKDKDQPEGPRQLYITKNKEGTCPMITLAFDGKHQTFSKSQSTGEVVQTMKAAAKKAQRQNREAANQEVNGQMAMLPPNTPVPFADKKEG